jgi:putative protease
MEFELATDIFSLEQLKRTDLKVYDAFYLGNSFCPSYKGNFSHNVDDLKEAGRILRGEGKKVYVTTHAAPRGDELEEVRHTFESARDISADGVEFHNMGVLYLASKEFEGIPLHAGVFANVYSLATASLLEDYGVRRILPNVEVPLDEMGVINEASPLEISVTLHGKIPLGIVHDCFLLEDGRSDEGCPEACLSPFWLKAELWEIMHVGKGIFSGLDLCTIEHIGEIVRRGFSFFRIESGYEDDAYRNEVGRVYRECLLRSTGGDKSVEDWWGKFLHKNSLRGFCNGYLFGKSGRIYIDAKGEEIASPMW